MPTHYAHGPPGVDPPILAGGWAAEGVAEPRDRIRPRLVASTTTGRFGRPIPGRSGGMGNAGTGVRIMRGECPVRWPAPRASVVGFVADGRPFAAAGRSSRAGA